MVVFPGPAYMQVMVAVMLLLPYDLLYQYGMITLELSSYILEIPYDAYTKLNQF